MNVVIIEDSAVQRIVGYQEIRRRVKCVAPDSPSKLLATQDGCDLIFSDRMMDPEWEDARNAYVNRNPQATVIEWCAVEDSCLIGDMCRLPRRDSKIIKTGSGRELNEALDAIEIKKYGTISPKNRLISAVGAFLGLAVTR